MLPGGVWRNGEPRREFSFRPLTGAIELSLAGGGEPQQSRPERVTAVLAAALDEIGGSPATPALVRRLAIADRQYLVRQLAARLDRDGLWLSARCAHCHAGYDVYVEQSKLPAKPGSGEHALAETTLGSCRLRLPDGGDQEAIAGLADPADARLALARRCLVALDGREVGPDEAARLELDAADLERIDQALEEVAPEVTLEVEAACPECGGVTAVWVDPYLCLDDGGELLEEIHRLATSYPWSEAELLALPRWRRKRYLELVERERGMVR